ncbi:hypothetical protein DL769_009613 [Monosporascus sp. CRB-8-3]|nr:hypothetical protein DL769_009613 [Monosporascus sp. CRB-8-3]
MSRSSIEEFKRKLAELDHEIALSASLGPHNSICALCQPVERRLNEITEARERDFFAGARDSSNNIHVGNLSHIFAHPDCPLCVLLIRLVLREKQQHLYNVMSSAGTNYVSVDDIKNALLSLSKEARTNADSSEESDDDNGWIEERYVDCFQISVDAIPDTGAISVWLPQEQADEVNDEESQLFMHSEDYAVIFGDPAKHLFLPRPDNGACRDMELMKRCYDYCKTHYVDCGRPNSSAMPSRLIDVLEMKVIEVARESTLEYLALSYVWGVIPFITLRSTNIAFLQSPNSLRDHSIQLPRTISDAIKIAQSFKFRYIWIDSLCIKQDDQGDQATEIQRMHEIYANARLTIVAATGSSAHAPLLHIDPNMLSNRYHPIGSHRFCLDRPEFQHVVSFTTWFTRGWTLQELICSARLLYFTPERTYYSCGARSWSEDFPLDPAMPAEIYEQYFRDDDPKGISFSGKEDASDCYTTMVEKLSIRHFTKDEDVMKALSGMYSMFALNKLGPATSGVPINFLEASLMWQPAGRLRRRIASSPNLPYPTWSWAGWTGPVTYPFYRIENLDLQPVVQWYLYRESSKDTSSQYVFADVTDLVAKPIASTKRTYWSLQPPELPSPLTFGKRTISKLDLGKQPVSSTAAILDHSILLCHARTYTVSIKRILGPELPTRAGLCYFSVIDGESNTIGEFKLETGTLHTLIGTKQPVAAEVLPIANLDFSSRALKDLLWMSRHSRIGQFSEAFMEVAEKDPNISIALWIDRQDGLSRRVALGYITSSSLSRSAGRDGWVILG